MNSHEPAGLISRWNLSVTKICRLESFNDDHNNVNLLSETIEWLFKKWVSPDSYHKRNSFVRYLS